jgi:NifU-like protein involved in Fe-S cluster formation
MKTTSIRLPIRNLPDQFDRSRISTVLDEIEMALMDDGGVYASTCADSMTMTITVEVPTNQLVDATACLKDLQLI